MKQITVTAKITAGFHPGLNTTITAGESYTIDESQFGDQLFNRPDPDWLAPWESTLSGAEAHAPTEQPQPAATPALVLSEVEADDTKTGGKKK